ncbi:L-threonylcarbamoyladenylate synthase [Acidiphilium acidophilum]|uniref:L-threonylcarbamoyladenylate synthase n=1 Tax=Acidiphilium acidophilum TaxID=76588 RepID=UPI002E8E67BF|nr:L-threonylcarbamoyladenylate synthase [Acidiphilium acidophilum]
MTLRLRDDADGIAQAAWLLRNGQLVAFATETVYGLGADGRNAQAVAAIYTAKGRPRFNPLICHFADGAEAFAHVTPDERAVALAAAFWPGPLTLVLPRRADSTIATLTGAGLPTIAVRVPAHETARALLRAAGVPIAAPSANRSGRLSPTTASHVLADLEGRIAAVIDSGAARVGLESTILDLSGARPRMLRPGGIAIEELIAVIGDIEIIGADEAVIAPGMMVSHYAPRQTVRLDARAPTSSEAWLGFGPDGVAGTATINLSEAGDLTEAAASLFDALHALEARATAQGLTGIAVAPIPRHGLGVAINDRLARAAAPR